jgi:ferrochelatase
MPFLENVVRGRRVPRERLLEVAEHYALFNGVSPITACTSRQAQGLRDRLRGQSLDIPVYVGMRNWHPFLADTLNEMAQAGVRRAIGFIAAPHRSYSSCAQYRENVRDARAQLQRAGLGDIAVVYVNDWHTHPDFVAANADRALAALATQAQALAVEAELVFTAHSIPDSQASRYPYRRQFEETARLVSQAVARESGVTRRYACVYQSRSGRPEDPWLGPDVSEYLMETAAKGLKAAVLCPIGFVCDHIEVLYDLDVEAAETCRNLGLPMARAAAVNDHPRFLDMMADVVGQVWRRYESGTPVALGDQNLHP